MLEEDRDSVHGTGKTSNIKNGNKIPVWSTISMVHLLLTCLLSTSASEWAEIYSCGTFYSELQPRSSESIVFI